MKQTRQDIIAQAVKPLTFLAGATHASVAEVAMKPKRVITPVNTTGTNLLDQFGVTYTEETTPQTKTAR